MFLVDMDVDAGGSLHKAFGDVTIGGTQLDSDVRPVSVTLK